MLAGETYTDKNGIKRYAIKNLVGVGIGEEIEITLKSDKVFSKKEISGISKKTGKPYKFTPMGTPVFCEFLCDGKKIKEIVYLNLKPAQAKNLEETGMAKDKVVILSLPVGSPYPKFSNKETTKKLSLEIPKEELTKDEKELIEIWKEQGNGDKEILFYNLLKYKQSGLNIGDVSEERINKYL